MEMKDLEFDFTCPSCHHKFTIKVKEMVPGQHQRCPYCQMTIEFTGDDGREAQKALDDLERTLRNLKF